MTFRFAGNTLGNFKQGEATNVELTLSVHSLQMMIDGNPLLNIDVFTNTFIVGDLDLLDKFRKFI